MSEMSQTDTCEEKTQHILSSLTLRKAPGKDNITTDMLHLTATLSASDVILLPFDQLSQLGQLPREWKTSVILPIAKYYPAISLYL